LKNETVLSRSPISIYDVVIKLIVT